MLRTTEQTAILYKKLKEFEVEMAVTYQASLREIIGAIPPEYDIKIRTGGHKVYKGYIYLTTDLTISTPLLEEKTVEEGYCCIVLFLRKYSLTASFAKVEMFVDGKKSSFKAASSYPLEASEVYKNDWQTIKRRCILCGYNVTAFRVVKRGEWYISAKTFTLTQLTSERLDNFVRLIVEV